MDVHLLAIQFRFYMGIVLVVISNDLSQQQESISRKIGNIIPAKIFLFPKMLIYPSKIFSSIDVMLLV